jgi:hypothetical protein
VDFEWRLSILMSVKKFAASVIGDSAALGEEEIGEEWIEEGGSASQRGPERALPNTRACRAHHYHCCL